MRGRKPEKFQLKPTDNAYLRKLLRAGRRFCCNVRIKSGRPAL